MKAIPKSLLIHSGVLQKSVLEDRWGKTEEISMLQLKDIRVEPSTKIIRDKNNAEIQLSATLFYDCKNSKPRGVIFSLDDLIIFNGEKHKIKAVEPLYDKRKLHHYEVGLIKGA